MSTNRKVLLVNNHYYHIYNRGVDQRILFSNRREFQRAINTVKYYQYKNTPIKFSHYIVSNEELKQKMHSFLIKQEKLVEVIAYCLMPNHFHFLLKQVSDNGISIFLSNFTNSYTKYFNTKNKRSGVLVQGSFKSVHIDDNEQLLHLSRYIHLNPVIAGLVLENQITEYPWSSLPEYLGQSEIFCKKEVILEQFSSATDYKDFVTSYTKYAQELKKIKNLLIEDQVQS